jgi:hypothetical protein
MNAQIHPKKIITRPPVTVCPHCGAKARTTRTTVFSAETKEIHYWCTNPDCGAQWVATFSFSRHIRPPYPKTGEGAAAALPRSR